MSEGIGSNSVDAGHLRAFVDRIENLESEKSALVEDIKEVYGEAKSSGLDSKIIRKIVSLRKKQEEARREEATIMSLYLDALGMQGELPL